MPYIIPCHQLRLDENCNIDNDANTLEEIVISLAEKIEWNTKEKIVYRLSDEIEQLEDRIRNLERAIGPVLGRPVEMHGQQAPVVEPPRGRTNPPQPKRVM